VGAIYLLTLRQLGGRWRFAIMTALVALPVLVALLATGLDDAPSVAQFESVVLDVMLAGSIIPLVALAIATPAFGNEVDDRTLANLTLAPVPRWKIALPKLLAPVTVAGAFVAASAFATGHIAFLGDTRATVAVTAGALAGVALYCSVFTWLGLVTSRAVWIGLAYVVLWEELFAGFVSGARLLSIRHHSVALMHAVDGRRFAEADPLGTGVALVVSALVFGGFLWLTVRRLRRMDVP
jgi:ABC-type transport system involved in multi-copper enzyme maturation permease subunit